MPFVEGFTHQFLYTITEEMLEDDQATELKDTEEELSSVATALQVLKIVGEKLSSKDIASLSKGLARDHSEAENMAAIASLGPTALAEANKSRSLPAYLRVSIRNAVTRATEQKAQLGTLYKDKAESVNTAEVMSAEPLWSSAQGCAAGGWRLGERDMTARKLPGTGATKTRRGLAHKDVCKRGCNVKFIPNTELLSVRIWQQFPIFLALG